MGADYYGGNIMVPWGEGPSPFERTADIHCPLIGLFGEEDGNRRGARYHAEADRDSWPRTLAFFEKYLGKAAVTTR
ncbi:MAG: hypothetical protein DMD81_26255 [Candidatus Rokuibacteriota bacterium]|nr:MAG: hypothetical protein DMD81_26255 [Candidatus Rokubacteria bacterium]